MAQRPLLTSDLPPGALGAIRQNRQPSVNCYYQPVEVCAPAGVRLALAENFMFGLPQDAPLHAAVMIGGAYRLQLTNIPNEPGVELYPTIEVIDRIFPPAGEEARFPVQIVITTDDLEQALQGALVTRVIYLEDPLNAFPEVQAPCEQRSLDVGGGQDPLHVADQFGRPVALLRLGTRTPPQQPDLLREFLHGSPPWLPLLPLETSAPVAAPEESAAITRQPHIPRDDVPVPVAEPQTELVGFTAAETVSVGDQPAVVQPAGHLRHGGRLHGGLLHAGLAAGDRWYACPPTGLQVGCGDGSNAGCQVCAPGAGLDPNEYICDGGDQLPRARPRRDGDPRGLNIEDTVAQYETLHGSVHVVPSNRVCIYAPRFASVRRLDGVVSQELALGPETANLKDGPSDVAMREPTRAVMNPLQAERSVAIKGPDAFRLRDRSVPVEAIDQPILIEDALAALINILEQPALRLDEILGPKVRIAAQAASQWTADRGVQVTIGELPALEVTRDLKAAELRLYEVGPARLQICKLANRHSAKPGEVVTFALRFDNVGGQPLRNVVIMDSLTTRLEYIEGSQTCTKGAKFSVERNDAESLRLRWELTDELAIGEGGVIHFRCKVR